jgi:hypothetical protein
VSHREQLCKWKLEQGLLVQELLLGQEQEQVLLREQVLELELLRL